LEVVAAMAPLSVQFVDKIDPNAAVRLDLTAGGWRVRREGTDVSPPTLNRAEVKSLLYDGVRVPASSYDARVLKLNLRVHAETADSAFLQLQNLARELDRPENIIRWQPNGASQPVFFKTYRSGIDRVYDTLMTRKEATLSILAYPFASGLRETAGTFTVSGDPATGCFFDLTGIKGDVQTRLILSMPASQVIASGRRTSLVAVRRRGDITKTPFFIGQAEAMALASPGGGQTTATGTDAAMSGNGYARMNGLTNAFVTRVTSAVYPAAPAPENFGTYRQFALLRKTNAADEKRVQSLIAGDSANPLGGPQVITPPGTVLRWADLGLFDLPQGSAPRTNWAGTPWPVRGAQFRLAAAETADGNGSLDVDCMIMVPADDAIAFVKWPAVTGPTTAVIDSTVPAAYCLGASGEQWSTQVITMAGYPLSASPGVGNRIIYIPDVGATSIAGHKKTDTTQITVEYYPQYLRVRPAGS
jgi:hypothetical protein